MLKVFYTSKFMQIHINMYFQYKNTKLAILFRWRKAIFYLFISSYSDLFIKITKNWTILFNKKIGADFPWVSNVNKLKRRTYAPALLLKNSCAVLRPVLRQAFFFWWRYYFLMKNYANNKWWRIHITSINR